MGRKPLNKKRINNPHIRADWIEQLMNVYLANGFRKYTMVEIAKLLGVSKATLYKYFSTRDEILKAVVELKIAQVSEFGLFLKDRNIPFQQRYTKALKTAAIEMASISYQFLQDIEELYPQLSNQVAEFADVSTILMTKFYTQGIEEGVLKEELDPNFLVLVDKIFIQAVANPDFLKENSLTLENAVEDYFNIKRKGIFK